MLDEPDDDVDHVLAAARGGDESAFTSLFRSVQPLLLRYLRTVARDGAVAADDVAAETWTSVVRGLDRFRVTRTAFAVGCSRSHEPGWSTPAGRPAGFPCRSTRPSSWLSGRAPSSYPGVPGTHSVGDRVRLGG